MIKSIYENSIYIEKLCVQAKIMIRRKRTYSTTTSTPTPSTSVTILLTAEKLLNLRFVYFLTFSLFLLTVLLRIEGNCMSGLFFIEHFSEI